MRDNKPKNRRRIIAEPLEGRLLFSATADMVLLDDGFANIDDLNTQADHTDLLTAFDFPLEHALENALTLPTADNHVDSLSVESLDADTYKLNLDDQDLDNLYSAVGEDSPLIDTIDTHQMHPDDRQPFDGELVFVDATLENREALISELQATRSDTDFEFITLDADGDGITQMSLVLAQYSGIKGIHVLSHASDGRLNLGGTQLNLDTLEQYRETLAQWQNAVNDDADILFYGCDLTASDEGVLLIQEIATITGTDVMASDDHTGHSELGGDWQLETRTGLIETQVLAAPTWQQTMLASSTNDLVNIWHDEVISGNVLTGEGGRLIRPDSFDTGSSGELVDITLNGTTYSFSSADSTGNLTINADGDTLVINRDGSYTYTSAYTSNYFNADIGWGSDFTFYGFSHGTPYAVNTQLTDLSTADVAVSQDANGLSVISGISDRLDNIDGQSETLVIDLNADRGYARITTSNLSAAESLTWEAYGADGTLIDFGTFTGFSGGGASDYSIVDIQTTQDFRYLAFQVPTNGGEMNIYEVRIADAPPLDKTFTYTATDTDGTTDTATFSVNYFNDNRFPSMVVNGSAVEGATLSTIVNDSDGITENTISYRWFSSSDLETWTLIDGANSAEYIVGAQQAGNYIRAEATYIDDEGTHESLFNQTATPVTGGNVEGIASLTGLAHPGSTLGVDVFDADGTTSSTYSYQWQVSNNGVNNWIDISSATASNLTLDDSYLNQYVRVSVSYTDDGGYFQSITSQASDEISTVNNLGDLLLSGNEQEHSVLTATPSDTDGIGSAVVYTWERSLGNNNWITVQSGTGTDTYTLTATDVGYAIRVTATYTDGNGVDERVQVTTSDVINAVNDGQGVTLSGSTSENSTITATITDPDGAPIGAPTYTWQRSDGNGGWVTLISGTDNTYTLSANDVGQQIQVVTSYTDGQGFNENDVAATTAVVTAVNDGQGIILTGQAVEDQTLIATINDPDGYTSGASYQWLRSTDNGTSWTIIAGATSSQLQLSDIDVGGLIRVIADYTDDQGYSETGVIATSTVVTGINDASVLTLSGIAVEDNTLISSLSDADGVSGPISYQWQRSFDGNNWIDIQNANSSSYTLTDADVGSNVRLTASYTDDQNNAETPVSATTAIVGGVNDPGVLTLTGNAVQNQQLTANITDPDGISGQINYQWQRSLDGQSWSTISNATGSSYQLSNADTGHYIRVSSTYVDDQSHTENLISSPSAIVANVNDAPQLLTPIAVQQATEDSRFSFTFPANTFFDPDGDPLTYSATTGGGSPLPGWLSFDSATRTFSGTPTASDGNSLRIQLTATDDGGQSVSTTFDIQISGYNDAPVTTGIADIQVNEDSDNTLINLNSHFSDEESGNNLRYSLVGNTNGGLFESITINQDTGQLELNYKENLFGETTLTLRATDEQGLSVETRFNVNVVAVNDRPDVVGHIADINRINTGATQQVEVPLVGVFRDIEDGTNLTYSIAGNTNPDLVQYTIDTERGVINLSLSAVSGNSTLMVRATDTDGEFVDLDFRVSVSAPNIPDPVDPEQPEPEPEQPTNPEPVDPLEPDPDPEPEEPTSPGEAESPVYPESPVINDSNYNAFLTLTDNLGSADIYSDDNFDDYNPSRERAYKPRPDDSLMFNRVADEPSSLGNLVAVQGGLLTAEAVEDFNVELVKLRSDMNDIVKEEAAEMAVYKGLTISLTTGLIIWGLRAGSFLLTLFSMIPIWRGLDPLPVIASKIRKEEEKKQKRDKTEEDRRKNEVGYLFDKSNRQQ